MLWFLPWVNRRRVRRIRRTASTASTAVDAATLLNLKQLLGSWGKTVPSLHELAVQSGIPGKLDVDGNQVARLWLSGLQREIVRYNEFDAVTTYLLWLRVAHFSGHFSEGEYAEEQQRVRDLLEENARSESGAHFGKYLKEWDRLEAIVASR